MKSSDVILFLFFEARRLIEEDWIKISNGTDFLLWIGCFISWFIYFVFSFANLILLISMRGEGWSEKLWPKSCSNVVLDWGSFFLVLFSSHSIKAWTALKTCSLIDFTVQEWNFWLKIMLWYENVTLLNIIIIMPVELIYLQFVFSTSCKSFLFGFFFNS